MAKMRAAQVRNGKGPFEIVEREIPDPGPGAVRVKVQASGICHSDSLTKEGLWPGIRYPRVPGARGGRGRLRRSRGLVWRTPRTGRRATSSAVTVPRRESPTPASSRSHSERSPVDAG